MFVSLSLSCARRLLIQAGYDVNIKDYDGWTPLHAAAHWGKEEACRVLVENLCDMDLINKMVSLHKSQALAASAAKSIILTVTSLYCHQPPRVRLLLM